MTKLSKKIGRPLKKDKDKLMVSITIRIPIAMLKELEKTAGYRSMSRLIRFYLREGLELDKRGDFNA